MSSRSGETPFGRYHPAVSFLYFLLVMLYSVLLLHPICLGISFLSAFAYYPRCRPYRRDRYTL